MKLHEIAKHPKSGSSFENLTVDTEAYGEIKVKVEYEYEESSTTRHGDDASFDERHSGSVDVVKVTLRQDVKEQDDDGEPTDKVVSKGSDVDKLKHWDDDKAVEKALDKALKSDD